MKSSVVSKSLSFKNPNKARFYQINLKQTLSCRKHTNRFMNVL